MGENTIILSFDMETDIGSWTKGTKGLTEGTPEILKVLAGHGVEATFLFTGREAENHPGVVEKVLSGGHEIGCHTMFHETLGNAVFDMPGDNIMLDGEVYGRLELATETVAKVSGSRPVSFRAPRLFGSSVMIDALERLGYLVDSSLPAYKYGRDFRPYHPSVDDWAVEGDMQILEIPPFYDTTALSDYEEGRDCDQWPLLRLKGSEWFSNLCRRMLKEAVCDDGNSVLCVYLHPWEFVEMPGSIITSEVEITFRPLLSTNCGIYSLKALDDFIGAMRSEGVTFTTMREYVSRGVGC